MKKDKIIQIAYAPNDSMPTLLTESGKVYQHKLDVNKYLGKSVNFGIEYDNYGYSYQEIKTI